MSEKEFCEYEAEAKKCESLGELFEAWINAQKSESCESCKGKEGEKKYSGTFPRNGKKGEEPRNPNYNIFKESFEKDGKLKLGKNEKELEGDTLFILKESNHSKVNRDNKELEPYTGESFWLQECIYKEINKKWIKGDAIGVFYKFRNRFANFIEGEETLQNANCFQYKYMNINKRGGYGRTDSIALKNYFKKYQEFILREIELLEVDNIVLCGKYDSEIVDTIKEYANKGNKEGKKIEVFCDLKHPTVASRAEYAKAKKCVGGNIK